MDLKDRYYWTKYRQVMNGESPHSIPVKKRSKHKIAFFVVIFYFSCIAFLFVATSDFSLETAKSRLLANFEPVQGHPPIANQKPRVHHDALQKPAMRPTVSQTPIEDRQPIAQAPKGVAIKADASGHYRGTLLINNIPMPFLVDTGATQTVIPTKMSYAARLPQGKAFQTNTANGVAVQHLTRINSFKIGNLELRNLEAATNDHLNEVLIGMNTLKLFRMTQDKNVLTLVANLDEVNRIESATEATPLHKAKTTWTKTVECDGNNTCKTSYR